MKPAVVLLLVAVLAAGCGGDDSGPAPAVDSCDVEVQDPSKAPDLQPLDPNSKPQIEFMTSHGNFTVEIDPVSAPCNGDSMVDLAKDGFFDGTRFHRIVPGFIIQGGDPTATGNGGSGYTTIDAPKPDTAYTKGVVAMAKSQYEQPGTGGQPVLHRHRGQREPPARLRRGGEGRRRHGRGREDRQARQRAHRGPDREDRHREHQRLGRLAALVSLKVSRLSATLWSRAPLRGARPTCAASLPRPEPQRRNRQSPFRGVAAMVAAVVLAAGAGVAVRRAEAGAAPARGAPPRSRELGRRRDRRHRRASTRDRRPRRQLPRVGARARRLAALRSGDAGRGVEVAVVVLADGPDLSPPPSTASSRPGEAAPARSSPPRTAATAATRCCSRARSGAGFPTRAPARFEPVLVPCDDLGSPGDVDLADEIPGRLRGESAE